MLPRRYLQGILRLASIPSDRKVCERMRKGFTLIELLVVIAIIAILASILFPVFSRAREKARQSSCLSNMKQLQLAALGYADDYDEMLPTNVHDINGSGVQDAGDMTWRSMIFPYVKNTQVFQCPSNKITSNPFTGGMDHGQGSGYGQNVVHWAGGSPTPPYGRDLGGCEDAASVIFLFESDGSESIGNTNGDDAHGWVPTANWAKRHNDGSNVSFVDGHVKWMKPGVFCKSSGDCLCSRELE